MAESKSPLEIVEISKTESSLWDNFVGKSPQGTFFHTTAWADAISDTFKKDYTILICIRNNETVGGVLYFSHKKLIWNLITPTPLYPYNAPIFYPPSEEKQQKTIHNQLEIASGFIDHFQKNYAFWILDIPSTISDMRSYLWKNTIVDPAYSYIIKLNDNLSLNNNFNQNLRKKIKQAEKSGAMVYESVEAENLIQMITQSYSRHSLTPLIPGEALRRFFKNVTNLPQVKIYYLKVNDIIKAGRAVVVDNNTVYDLLAGSDDTDGFESAYLVSHILHTFVKSHKYFDFMGADHPQIEKFKRGFGGELVEGYRVTSKPSFPVDLLVKMQRYRLSRERDL